MQKRLSPIVFIKKRRKKILLVGYCTSDIGFYNKSKKKEKKNLFMFLADKKENITDQTITEVTASVIGKEFAILGSSR